MPAKFPFDLFLFVSASLPLFRLFSRTSDARAAFFSDALTFLELDYPAPATANLGHTFTKPTFCSGQAPVIEVAHLAFSYLFVFVA